MLPERKSRRRSWMAEPPLDIRDFYRDVVGISGNEVLDLFENNTRYIRRHKGAVFIHAGESIHSIRFLVSGVVRGYVLDENGKDNVVCFCYEPGDPLIGSSILPGRNILFMEAVTDVEMLELPVSIGAQSLQMNFGNLEAYEEILTNVHEKQTRIQVALNTMNGRERYYWFLKEYKPLVDTVPQNYIASFLGIQPQSLSRIKRQLKEKNAQ